MKHYWICLSIGDYLNSYDDNGYYYSQIGNLQVTDDSEEPHNLAPNEVWHEITEDEYKALEAAEKVAEEAMATKNPAVIKSFKAKLDIILFIDIIKKVSKPFFFINSPISFVAVLNLLFLISSKTFN